MIFPQKNHFTMNNKKYTHLINSFPQTLKVKHINHYTLINHSLGEVNKTKNILL